MTGNATYPDGKDILSMNSNPKQARNFIIRYTTQKMATDRYVGLKLTQINPFM